MDNRDKFLKKTHIDVTVRDLSILWFRCICLYITFSEKIIILIYLRDRQDAVCYGPEPGLAVQRVRKYDKLLIALSCLSVRTEQID